MADLLKIRDLAAQIMLEAASTPPIEGGGEPPREDPKPPVEGGGEPPKEEPKPPVEGGGEPPKEEPKPPVEGGGEPPKEEPKPPVEGGGSEEPAPSPTPVPGQTVPAGHVAGFMAALMRANGGENIALAPGAYDNITLNGRKFSTPVTITAEDADAPPVFDNLTLSNCQGIRFDGVAVYFKPTAATQEYHAAVKATNCDGVHFLNSNWAGGPSIAGIDENLPAGSQGNAGIKGWPIGSALLATSCKNMNVSGNTTVGFTNVFKFVKCEVLNISDNDMSGYRRTPINGGGNIGNITVDRNHLHAPRPWKLGPKGDHGDFVHFWTQKGQAVIDGLSFVGNVFDQAGAAEGTMGINLESKAASGGGSGLGYSNVLIDRLLYRADNYQAIAIGQCDGLIIQDSTMVCRTPTPAKIPKVNLGSAVKNARLDRCIHMGLSASAKPAQGKNVQLTAAQIGAALTNPFDAVLDPSDMTPVAGGVAVGLGAI